MKHYAMGVAAAAFLVLSASAGNYMLPFGYVPLEYIQGDGTAYILTDYTANTAVDVVSAEFEITSGNVATIWCTRGKTTTTSTFTLFYLGSADGNFRFDYYTQTTGKIPLVPEEGKIYTVTAEHRKVTFSSGESYQYTSGDAFTASGPLMIFASHYNGVANNVLNHGDHRLYSFKVTRSGTVVRDFVPCRRASDGAAGLYDTVTGEFFGNAGSAGAFTAGPESDNPFSVEFLPSLYCTKSPLTPALSVTDRTTGEVIDPSNYDLAYADNVDVGRAKVTVTGKAGTAYEGYSGVVFFDIFPLYHVTAYSLEKEGDGLTWETPMSLTNALVKVSAGDTIYLKSGEYIVSNRVDITKAVIIEGGFAGTDNVTLDEDNPISVLTQLPTTKLDTLVYLTASSGDFKMKRVQIQNARQYGMQKSSAACNFYVSDCVFVSNGFSCSAGKSVGYYGKGLRINGSASSEVVVSNCLFAYNCQTNNATGNSGGPAAAFYVGTSKKALVVDTKFFGNCAFLGKSGDASSHSNLYDLHPQGSAIYAPSRIHLLRCDFRANVTHIRSTSTSGGVVWFAAGSTGSTVSNCIFAGNLDRVSNGNTSGAQSGAIIVDFSNAGHKINIYGSTFACNYSDTTEGAGAITARKGIVDISNCVFGGNTMHPSTVKKAGDIKVFSTGVVNIEYSVLGGPKESQVFCQDGGSYNEGEGVVYSDPMLVTPSSFASDNVALSGGWRFFPNTREMYEKIYAIDVHLLSKGGYVTNGAPEQWLVSEYNSPAIDAGNPAEGYSFEPQNNGSRRNAGAYGNTPEASKSFVSETPFGFTDISVVYPDGYSSPEISFTVTGEENCFLDAMMTIEIDGVLSSISIAGCRVGETYSWTEPSKYYPEGTVVNVSISGTSTAGEVITSEGSFEIAAGLPPWWGHGGGEGVLHVWADAPGDASGSDWHNACRSWNELVIAYNARSVKPSEIWFISLKKPTMTTSTLTVSTDLVLRGGFTYEMDSASERPEGTHSVLSAQFAYDLCLINNTAGTLKVERLDFTGSSARGLTKTGAGNLEVRDCRFYDNSTADNVSGRGLYASGSAASTYVSVSNCLFARNGLFRNGNYNVGNGGAAYFSALKRVTVDDCLFITNGVALVGSPNSGAGRDNTSGGAICVSGVPIVIRNTSFIGNNGVCRNTTGGTGGSAIYFAGNCNGAVISNCLVAGGSDRCGWSGQEGSYGGALRIKMSSSSCTVDVVNTTIAYNLADGISAPGGINVQSGTVNLENCIVYGNFSSRRADSRNRFGADVDVKAGGVLNARYTLFTEDSTNSITWAEGGVVNLGEGVIYGDPSLVSDLATVRTYVQSPYGTGYTYFKTESIAAGTLAKIVSMNLHLRGGRGYIDEKTGALVTTYQKEADSPAIDAGDPSASFAKEVDCVHGWHGRRVNMGAYGNTPYATMSPFPGAVLRIR